MALCKKSLKKRMEKLFFHKKTRLFQSFRKTPSQHGRESFPWQVTSALQLRLDEAFRSRSAGCCRCNLFAAKVRNATACGARIFGWMAQSLTDLGVCTLDVSSGAAFMIIFCRIGRMSWWLFSWHQVSSDSWHDFRDFNECLLFLVPSFALILDKFWSGIIEFMLKAWTSQEDHYVCSLVSAACTVL